MAKSEFLLAFNEIADLRKLPRETIIEALRQALVSAYRRDMRASSAQRVEAEIDIIGNQHKIFVEKEVVTEVKDDNTEVSLEKAIFIDPDAKLDDMVMVPIETNIVQRFGRIAAQTAKQVISQKIRDAERNQLYEEFKEREGELVSGQVQSVNASHVTLMIDRAEVTMPRKEQIPGERYHQHEKIRVYISEVKKSTRDPQIIVSRANKNVLRRLLEYEVPEIYNKQVEIKSIAREAGHRSKVAVFATQPGVDPLGACVGPRGMRIQNIVKELNDEKIDVIPWDADNSVFIAKALSPARVSGVYLEQDIDQGKTALVIVPDDQLSLAIGREGQNARLAAKLTGWRIDIKSVTEAAMGAMTQIDEPPLNKIAIDTPDTIVEVQRIIDKKRADRAVMPEEYTTLARFVQLVEQRLLEQREVGRSRRKKAMDKIRSTVPLYMFQVPVREMNLPEMILSALKNIETAGDLMLHVQADSEKLHEVLRAAKADDDAMTIIEEALEDVLRTKAAALVVIAPEPAAAPIVVEAPIAAAPAASIAPVGEPPTPPVETIEDEEEAPPAFIDDIPLPAKIPEGPRMRKVPKVVTPEAVAQQDAVSAPEGDDEDQDGDKKGKKGKERSRELVFDEDLGQVVAKRKRKGGRGGFGWSGDE